MGIDYRYSLCMGFEIPAAMVEDSYLKEDKIPGTFHMEDRFDPKTGVKLTAEKVWDKKATTVIWYEFDGKSYPNLDPEDWEKLLGSKFDCYVEKYGCYMTGNFNYVFHVNKPVSYKEARNEGHFTFYNESISCDEVFQLLPKVLLLQDKLTAAGWNPSKPRIFLAECVS